LELVNNEYQAFLNLGRDLKGGEERVEGVRVGLLGFVNGVNGMKTGVKRRRDEVEQLVTEKEEIAKEAEKARALVEVHERIEGLEEALQPKWADGQQEVPSEDDDDDEEGGGELYGGWEASVGFLSFGRLKRLVGGYKDLRQMMEGIGMDHPFLVKQEERMMRIRNTLLLDLGAALRQVRSTGVAGHERLLQVAALYADINEEKEGLKVLKETVQSVKPWDLKKQGLHENGSAN
jgi:conserved oligomeric Golgi complex subunit 2